MDDATVRTIISHLQAAETHERANGAWKRAAGLARASDIVTILAHGSRPAIAAEPCEVSGCSCSAFREHGESFDSYAELSDAMAARATARDEDHRPPRVRYLESVAAMYPPAVDCDADPQPVPRYVGVEGDRSGYWLTFADTETELFGAWTSDDSDYRPLLLVDLDTGEGFAVEISYSRGYAIAERFPA